MIIEESINRVNQNNSKATLEWKAIKELIDEASINISIIKAYAKKKNKDSF